MLNLIKIKGPAYSQLFWETKFRVDATTIQNEHKIISGHKLIISQQTQEGEHKPAISNLTLIKTHQSEVEVEKGF